MADPSDIPKVLKDGIITLYDDTAVTRLEVEIQCEDGTFTVDPGQPESVDIYDRDQLCASREGRVPIGTLSFAVHMREFTNAAIGTPVDFIEGTGGYSARLPTGNGRFEGFVVGVQYDALSAPGDTPTLSTRTDSPITRMTWNFAEGNPDIINFTGQVYGGVIRTAEDVAA